MKTLLNPIKLLLIVLSTFLLCACQLNTSSTSHYSIGLVISNLENPFFQAMNAGAQTEANANDVSLKVLASNDSSSLELLKVKSLIDSGIDILIINPTDSDSVYQSVRYANQKNIPVITVDRISTGGQIVCHIASNNEAGGKLAAQYMIESTGNSGKYAALKGIEGTSASIMRGKGFQDYMVSNGQMIQVSSLTASFDRSLGQTMMAKLLNVHPDLAAVFAENDEMALGAIEAIQARGLKTIVVGFDGTPEALKAIENGSLSATIAQQPEKLGSEAVLQALAYLQNKKVPETVLVDVKLITKQ